MPDLELTRTREDRRLYDLEGVGTLRLGGIFSRGATAEAGTAAWEFARRGILRPVTEASDATGTVVGHFEPRAIKRGGMLRWGGRELELRPATMWKERYALTDGDRDVAVVDGKSWGKRPVRITVDDPGALDAGLLLFAAFVVKGLAEDSSANAGGGAAAGAATTG